MAKNKDMSEQTEKQKAKTYVWVKTERAGDTVIVEGTEGQFTTFTDGTKCATALIGEMLMEARDEDNAASLAKSFKTVKEVAIEPVTETKTTQPTGELNVMLEMLKKISAKNTITMPLELNVPSKDVYDLFKDQMDITKADLNEQILLLVQSQINNLQEQLKPQAEEFIKNYYNGKTKRRVSATDTGATTSNRSSSNTASDIPTY
jgi:hypothetical protein